MEEHDITLFARAAEALALLMEEHLGYPDAPERLILSAPNATSVITEIFRRLIEEGAPIPAPVAHLVTHLYAPSLFSMSMES